jgi:adenylate cyclase
VRNVLEGSLRKSGNRIRVTAQLVEAETGKHIWAERYESELADIFTVQDNIAEAVTTATAPAIDAAERQRAMRIPPENLDAWAAYRRGLWHYSKINREENALAPRCRVPAAPICVHQRGSRRQLTGRCERQNPL